MGAVTLEEPEVAVEGGLERDVGIRGLGSRCHRDGGRTREVHRARAWVRVLAFWALPRWRGERGT
jgi:hypothetical protein